VTLVISKAFRALPAATISARSWSALPIYQGRFGLALGLALILCTAHAAAPSTEDDSPSDNSYKQPWFLFDKADEILPATLLENPFSYDAGIAAGKEGLWLTWLEFQPGKGDQLLVGLRGKGGWINKAQLTSAASDYANPTITLEYGQQPYLTYEGLDPKGNWQVFVRPGHGQFFVERGSGPQSFNPPFQLSDGAGPNIAHRSCVCYLSGIWSIWQSGSDGHFSVAGAGLTSESLRTLATWKSGAIGNSWAPALTATIDTGAHAVWDASDARAHRILYQSLPSEPHTSPTTPLCIASSTNFQAHAQIASGKDGKLWVLWEEDGENWGQRYTARNPGDKNSTHMSDKIGPLHRFRRLHLAELNEKESSLKEYEIPQPSFDLARHRTNAPPDLKDFGAFYESGQLVVDGQNRPWIVYRHFYVPWIGIVLAHHKQENMRIYARCLLPDGWSKLYSFKEGQGDGGQRISVSPEPDGIALAWTVGRTDRRKTKDPHGVAFAEIKAPDLKPILPVPTHIRKLTSQDKPPEVNPRRRASTDLAGKHYELWYGDLHRHTDISLCFSPVDGTIDDAYRYAIDAAPLDFLGITDHTHDLAMGDELALIWWRSRKEVNRHLLPSFIPFFSYERSRGDTDHNVISLRDDMLRPHTYPLPQFWKELDTNTLTIPHQPFNPVLWKNKDDVHRPLLEIYQGMRNNIEESDMQQGLNGGHHFGIISSSDHLSTGASFACVWSDKPTREGIFRSMQARRTFGATAKIVLKVTAGDHWMGEIFSAKKMPPIQIEAQGSADIKTIDVLIDGKVAKTFPCNGSQAKLSYESPSSLTGNHIFFIRLQQTDGNHAWSSPLWIDIQP